MGLGIKIVIEKKDGEDGEKEEDMYNTSFSTSGKYQRKAKWEDLEAFCGRNVNSDVLREWIDGYQTTTSPHVLEEPNRIPFKCFIFDEPKKGFTIFKDYDWNPVKILLKPGVVDIKKQYTQQVTLDEFDIDAETDLMAVIKERGDKDLTSSLTKS